MAANVIQTPYRTEKGYFQEAWRRALRTQFPQWKTPALTVTVNHIWQSRTVAEHLHCTQLVANQSLALPPIDVTIMPLRASRKDWKTLVARAGPYYIHRTFVAAAAGPVVPPGLVVPLGPALPPGPAPPLGPAAPAPPAPAPRVNTTNFSFWPQAGTHSAQIPDEDAPLHQMFSAGTLLPTPADGTWMGVHVLGAGSGGKVSLWIKRDAANNIIDRMAIKDTKTQNHDKWTSPFAWRDNLPREIAVGQRLTTQGHTGTIGLRSFALNMRDRRYRQYLDFCDFQDLFNLMMPYARGHCRAPPIPNTGAATIPEAFIWYVFQSLLDTLFVFRDGRNQALSNGEHWRTIVHLDFCAANIFIAPAVDDEGNVLSGDSGQSTKRNSKTKIQTVNLPREHWPSLKVGDFDRSMFSLQDTSNPANPDAYADNPMWYIMRDQPLAGKVDSGARFPPELFNCFYGIDGAEPGSRPLDTATDVWALGQVLWCLLTNYQWAGDFRPRWDLNPTSPNYRRLQQHVEDPEHFVNAGARYAMAKLDNAMFVRGPGATYSDDLKRVVRACLYWDPAARPGLEGMRNLVNRAMTRAGQGLPSANGEYIRVDVPVGFERYVVPARMKTDDDDE